MVGTSLAPGKCAGTRTPISNPKIKTAESSPPVAGSMKALRAFSQRTESVPARLDGDSAAAPPTAARAQRLDEEPNQAGRVGRHCCH